MRLDIYDTEWYLLMEALDLLQENFPDRSKEIKKLKLNLSDQKEQLEDNSGNYFGVAYGAAPTSSEEDYYTYRLILTSFPESAKINTIKVLREIASLNMQEAFNKIKELPSSIKNGLSKSDADYEAYQFTRLGCGVIIEKDGTG